MLALNLLPPKVKTSYIAAAFFSHLRHILLSGFIILLIGNIGAMGIQFLLHRHATATQSELESQKNNQATSNGQDITHITSELNATIKMVATTLGEPRSWASDVSVILNGLPAAITISELTMNPNGQFTLVGKADSRQAFIEVENALKNNTRLQKITTTSTASKRTALPFTFSGFVIPIKPT